MEKIKLSKRLLEATKFTKPGQEIADIGSDHAYLPIYLVQNEIVETAIAGEVVEGPYTHAKQTVEAWGLEQVIDVRFGDGLDVLNMKEDIGTIFICGMGGILISDILNKGKLSGRLTHAPRLVLQPNNSESYLRNYLVHESYEITEESIVEENGKIYEIIVAEYSESKVSYSELELMFGPKLMQSQPNVFQKKWHQELNKSQEILNGLSNSNNKEKINEFTEYIDKIEKVIL